MLLLYRLCQKARRVEVKLGASKPIRENSHVQYIELRLRNILKQITNTVIMSTPVENKSTFI